MNDNLISRAAAIDILDAYQVMVENGEEKPYAWARMRMSELPSVQPEIIHCRDCKHFGTDKYKKLTWCGRKDYGYGWGKNDFCSKAERRTDDANDIT